VTCSAAVFRGRLLAGLWLAVLAGCSTVDLGRHYEPPTILMPQSAPAPQAAPANDEPPQPAQARPVTPGQPQLRPLPPVGSALPPPEAAPPAQAAQGPAADDPDAHLLTFTTHMSAASAVPPADSAATGQLDALYDSSTGLLRWKTVWSGLRGPITSVQFHGPADSGQNAPPTIIWPAPFGPTYEGRVVLTPQQAQGLLAGRWYVNVATTAYPAGELRGQLRQVEN